MPRSNFTEEFKLDVIKQIFFPALYFGKPA